MISPARVKDWTRKGLAILPAVPVCALGVAFFVRADMGADPFTSLQLGIAGKMGVPVGWVSLGMNMAIVAAFFFIKRELVGLGSFLFALGIGPCINLFTELLWRITPGILPLWVRLVCLPVGSLFMAVALAWYLPIKMGASGSDIIALYIAGRLNKSYGFCRAVYCAVLFAAAVALGSSWGLGTVINLFFIGYMVDFIMRFTAPLSRRAAGMNDAKEEPPCEREV